MNSDLSIRGGQLPRQCMKCKVHILVLYMEMYQGLRRVYITVQHFAKVLYNKQKPAKIWCPIPNAHAADKFSSSDMVSESFHGATFLTRHVAICMLIAVGTFRQ